MDDAEQKDIQQALVLVQQGNYEGAELIYKRLIEKGTKEYVVFDNLAIIYYMKNRIEEMIMLLKEALRLNPNYPGGLTNLGTALRKQGDLPGAIQLYKKALAIKPDFLNALLNLGLTLLEQEEFQAAIDYYKQALAIDPKSLETINNLGFALKEQGELQESIALYRKAIFLKEDYWNAHFNLAFSLLLSGDYENGWREYEWRLNKLSKLNAYPQFKRWDGCNNLSGNKLLLVREGGFGDTLHFMRYIPYLIKRGTAVAFYAQTKLHGLIQASEITTEIYSSEEAYQLTTGEWLPLQSLSKCLNVRPDNPLVTESYIKSPKENILFWKQKLSSESRPIIGICWQGNPKTEKFQGRGRSFPLKIFAPIIETIDVRFLSLQKGFGSEQLTDCRFLDRFVGCQEEINQTWDFVENAAIMMNCDLIITTDSCVAHLAGRLGQPTWLLLQKVPEWRWGMEGSTTFWYPSMRLFRQREHGNWSEVMDRVASALQIVFSDMDSPMAGS